MKHLERIKRPAKIKPDKHQILPFVPAYSPPIVKKKISRTKKPR